MKYPIVITEMPKKYTSLDLSSILIHQVYLDQGIWVYEVTEREKKYIMQAYPKDNPMFIDIEGKEWAYVYYLLRSIGVDPLGLNTKDLMPMFINKPSPKSESLVLRIDADYLRKHVRLIYLQHVTSIKDHKEWHGNDVIERDKIMADLTTALNRTT